MDATALYEQGHRLWYTQQRDRAVAVLTQAADLGSGRACWLLGQQFSSSDPRRLVWLRRGSDLADDACRVALAQRLLEPPVSADDEREAAGLLEAAAGHHAAARMLTALRRRQRSRGRAPEERLAAAIDDHRLSGHAGVIGAAVLPSVRLVPTASSDDDTLAGASRLGGSPDLSADAQWPRRGDRPLSFIAQVDLAEVAPVSPVRLPPRGLLSFFYDVEEMPWGHDLSQVSGWRVTFDPGASARRRVPAPEGATVFTAMALTPRREWTLPFPRTMEGRALGLDDEALERYFDMRESFPDDYQHPYSGRVRHRMFGHPDAIQGDMRRRIESIRRGVDLADETPDLDEAARRWVLLLQVESDDNAGMMWGDQGSLFYWIPADALAAADFTAVHLQLQCH